MYVRPTLQVLNVQSIILNTYYNIFIMSSVKCDGLGFKYTTVKYMLHIYNKNIFLFLFNRIQRYFIYDGIL